MTQQFKLPDLGEGLHESEIIDVPVSVGDTVEEDEVILTVETDKATVDIPSPFAGKVQQIHVKAGEIVHVGDVLLTFDGDGEREAQPEPKKPQKSAPEVQETKAQSTQAKQPVKQAQQPSTGKTKPPAGRPVPASPDTRRRARELKIALQDVEGSGPGGRVTRSDVEAFAEMGRPQQEGAGQEEPQDQAEPTLLPEALELPDFSQWGPIERQPLRSVRRVTARRMAQTWAQIPHVTHHDKADVTRLEKLRKKYQEELHLENLTLLAFVMEAVVAALKKFPRFNASLDPRTDEIVLKHYYHLGVAVDTDRGLIVPVIRDVDRKSLTEVANDLEILAERTRAGDTDLQEMQGGTFTITNVGPIGGTHFNPLINFPHAAILGMARRTWEPVVRTEHGEKVIVPRNMLPLVLAFDHRLADGAEAARFLNDVISMLEDPARFMLRL
jgi:pyruvate dehydrogenase E2 component (dihydrolipoamide acetyltransferase)